MTKINREWTEPYGNEIIVAKVNGDYSTIQAGINAASAGDVVVVYPGDYVENVTLADGIGVVGIGRGEVVIKPTSGNALAGPSSGLSVIENLTIELSAGTLTADANGLYMSAGTVHAIDCAIDVSRTGGNYHLRAILMEGGTLKWSGGHIDWDISGATGLTDTSVFSAQTGACVATVKGAIINAATSDGNAKVHLVTQSLGTAKFRLEECSASLTSTAAATAPLISAYRRNAAGTETEPLFKNCNLLVSNTNGASYGVRIEVSVSYVIMAGNIWDFTGSDSSYLGSINASTSTIEFAHDSHNASLFTAGTGKITGIISQNGSLQSSVGTQVLQSTIQELALVATSTDPTSNNDSDEGFAVGTEWINTSSDTIFKCADATPSSAVWKDISASGGGFTAIGAFFVGKHGSDSNDGKSWATAKLTIGAAISAAAANDIIWIADDGTYTENLTIGDKKIYGPGATISGYHTIGDNGVLDVFKLIVTASQVGVTYSGTSGEFAYVRVKEVDCTAASCTGFRSSTLGATLDLTWVQADCGSSSTTEFAGSVGSGRFYFHGGDIVNSGAGILIDKPSGAGALRGKFGNLTVGSSGTAIKASGGASYIEVDSIVASTGNMVDLASLTTLNLEYHGSVSGTIAGAGTLRKEQAGHPLTDVLTWVVNGKISVATSVDSARFTKYSGKIVSCQLYRKTAGTSGSTTVDINKNGTTVFTTQANRPSISYASGSDATSKKTNMDVTTFSADDRFQVDLDAVDGGNPQTITVEVHLEYDYP